MSIANVIQNIQTHLSNAYDTIENKGVDLTNVDKNIENLSTEINLIQSGGGGGRDWSAIGYSGEPDAIAAGYDYAKHIYDNWNNTTTSMSSAYYDDRKIMIMRYGLFDTEEMTQKDVANILGISQSYISRIEKKVIKRLKQLDKS